MIPVLDEITSSLINQEMFSELLKVEEVYNHGTMKQLIDDIAQSSIMRLDPVSMDRLWDLITMVFKWQVTLSQNVLEVTARHLYEIETFTTNPETQLQLHRVQNVIDNFEKILSPTEKVDLTERIIIWLHHYNVRVSLLLRLGFQNQDGSFKMNNFDSKYTSMLENIGENIYAATKNYNLSKAQEVKKQNKRSEKYELNTMINQILGEDNQNKNVKESAQFFKLSLCDTYEESDGEKPQNANIYSEIDVSNSTSALQDIFNDVSTNETVTNIHDDLLNIIDENC